MARHTLTLQGGLPVIRDLQIQKNGIPVRGLVALVDTGTISTIIGLGVEELLQLTVSDRMGLTNGFNEDVPTRLYDNSTITLPQGDVFNNITVGCTGQLLYRRFRIHMILGMDIILRGSLILRNGEYSLEFPNNP